LFRLSKLELDELVTICDRLRPLKHSSSVPQVFTELGVAMIASILNSPDAIRVSIEIVRVFVTFRNQFVKGEILVSRVSNIEEIVLEHSISIKRLNEIYKSITPQNHGIFFNDQIFDAYVFACDLIQKAKHSIILIDNYIDETTLLQLSKRNEGVSVTIFTQKITTQLQLDLTKHNAQYPPVIIKTIKHVHDRFLIIDDKELYHIGASLKDLGKKWFAFSRIDSLIPEVKKKL